MNLNIINIYHQEKNNDSKLDFVYEEIKLYQHNFYQRLQH